MLKMVETFSIPTPIVGGHCSMVTRLGDRKAPGYHGPHWHYSERMGVLH